MNHSPLLLSRMVKPGVMPSLLADMTVHGPGDGPSLVFDARATISGVSGILPARLA